MEITKFNIPGFEWVKVHHNPDWSGNIIVFYKEEGGESERELVIPIMLFMVLGKEVAYKMVSDFMIDIMEGGNKFPRGE